MEPNEDYELSRLLREWQVSGAPAELEARVLCVRRAQAGWVMALVAANAALLVIGILLSGVTAPPVRPSAASAPVLSADPDGEMPFVPVPYAAPLDSYETGTVLRMNVPVAALIRAGYRVPAADPAAIVEADVLVGDDGRAHAVRLVSGLSLESGGD